MKSSKLLMAVIALLASLSCISQTSITRIEIVQPTVEQEATSIWRTIDDIVFFEKQGYVIHLPEDPLIDSLILKSKNGTFGNESFPVIYEFVETKVFDSKNYELAIQKVEKQTNLIDHLVSEIDIKRSQWDWGFKMFDKYSVVFTLYGTGGSYNPDDGTITLLTNADGGFMNYEDPTNTIIHEITHMGMEDSIVKKYDISHGLKERLVDTFVYLMFKKALPEYNIQNMGDDRIDKYLQKPEDLGSLDVIISEFISR